MLDPTLCKIDRHCNTSSAFLTYAKQICRPLSLCRIRHKYRNRQSDRLQHCHRPLGLRYCLFNRPVATGQFATACALTTSPAIAKPRCILSPDAYCVSLSTTSSIPSIEKIHFSLLLSSIATKPLSHFCTYVISYMSPSYSTLLPTFTSSDISQNIRI